MTITTHQGGGITVTGPDSIRLYALLTLKSAMRMYIKTGMKVNKAYTPANMMAMVAKHTGKTYKRSDLAKALADLEAYMVDTYGLQPKDLVVGGKYNWKNQKERLVYLGKKGSWHQFALVEEQFTVWCEVQDDQIIESFEVTKP